MPLLSSVQNVFTICSSRLYFMHSRGGKYGRGRLSPQNATRSRFTLFCDCFLLLRILFMVKACTARLLPIFFMIGQTFFRPPRLLSVTSHANTLLMTHFGRGTPSEKYTRERRGGGGMEYDLTAAAAYRHFT